MGALAEGRCQRARRWLPSGWVGDRAEPWSQRRCREGRGLGRWLHSNTSEYGHLFQPIGAERRRPDGRLASHRRGDRGTSSRRPKPVADISSAAQRSSYHGRDRADRPGGRPRERGGATIDAPVQLEAGACGFPASVAPEGSKHTAKSQSRLYCGLRRAFHEPPAQPRCGVPAADRHRNRCRAGLTESFPEIELACSAFSFAAIIPSGRSWQSAVAAQVHF